MLTSILKIVICLFLLVVGMFLAFYIATIIRLLISQITICKRVGFKYFKKRFFKRFMYSHSVKVFDFVKWVAFDILHGKDYFKLFGVWCFTGYYGQGKTLGAIKYAYSLREKYSYKNIKIYSNFNLIGQDGSVECWQDLLKLPKCSIVIFDEIQSTFSSTEHSKFPIDLLWHLTQCRKEELAIFCSSPVYTRMSIQLRESCDYIIECSNFAKLDRWFRYAFFREDKYEKYKSDTGKFDFLNKRKYIEFNHSFIATNKDYGRYDTKQKVDRLDVQDTNTKVNKTDFNMLRNLMIKEIEERMKKQGA
jgi:hypothetical protein